MKAPAPAFFPLLLLMGLLSSCAMSTRQFPGKVQAVIHTQDELYQHLHGSGSSGPEENHYLGTTKDGFHIVRTSHPPWWLFQPTKIIAIRQEVLPQWHPRPYPLPRRRWLPVPWIVFCPYKLPTQAEWERQRRKYRNDLLRLQAERHRVEREWADDLLRAHPELRSKLPAPKPPSRSPSVPYALNTLSIDHLPPSSLTPPGPSPQDIASQNRQPDAAALRQRDALIQAD